MSCEVPASYLACRHDMNIATNGEWSHGNVVAIFYDLSRRFPQSEIFKIIGSLKIQ